MEKRVFHYGEQVWEDPGAEFSNEDVKKHLTQFFPELAQAVTEVKSTDGVTHVTFVKKAGTKGLTTAEIVERLAGVPPLQLVGFSTVLQVVRSELPAGAWDAVNVDELITALRAQAEAAELVGNRCLAITPLARPNPLWF